MCICTNKRRSNIPVLAKKKKIFCNIWEIVTLKMFSVTSRKIFVILVKLLPPQTIQCVQDSHWCLLRREKNQKDFAVIRKMISSGK